MDIERLRELKLAAGVVFQHWLDTTANQKGFDNTESKKLFKKDAECIQELIDEAIARQSVTECKWKCRDDYEYFSECRFQMFRENSYSLSENGFRYCPKCGKKISNVENIETEEWVQVED